MNFFIKLTVSVTIIVLATHPGRKVPSLAGLVTTMPLAGFIVLVWIYLDNPQNTQSVIRYTEGALWGILPSILVFLVAAVCMKRSISLPFTLLISFTVWGLGALVHQCLLKA